MKTGLFRDAAAVVQSLWSISTWRVSAVLVLMIVASLTEGLSIVMMVPLLRLLGPDHQSIDLAVPRRAVPLLGTHVTIGLVTMLVAFVLFVVVRAFMVRTKDIMNADLLFRFINRMRTDLFAAVSRARWDFILCVRTSDLNHALTADIDRVQTATMQIMTLVQSLVLLAAYLLISLLLSPTLTFVAGGIGLMALIALSPIRRRASRFGASLTASRQIQYRIVDEFLGGLKIAKSLDVGSSYLSQLKVVLSSIHRNTLAFLRLYSAGGLAFQFISSASMALFIYIAIRVIMLPLAILLALILLFVRISPRIVALQATMQDIIINLHAFKAIAQMRARCEAASEPSLDEGDPAPSGASELDFLGICFQYPTGDGRVVLHDVTLNAPANMITTIVGPSGSGKSTIADMLLHLLEPTAGSISVNGVPLASINRVAWRAQIAYVQQDTFLAHATIAQNLQLSSLKASRADMWEALKIAHVADFVRSLPDQLDTVVGERGVRLSGGERQRIALARAMLRRPALLVLDEATSSLDWDSRQQVVRSIAALKGKTTIIAIDHGYGMAAIADHVVVLNKGRVIESGPPADLLASGSGYLNAMRSSEQVVSDETANLQLVSESGTG